MGIVIYLLILLLVAVIANYVIDQCALPANINWVAKLIVGLIILICVLQAVLPLVPNGPMLR